MQVGNIEVREFKTVDIPAGPRTKLIDHIIAIAKTVNIGVAAKAAAQRVVARPAIEHVIACPGAQQIIARPGNQKFIAPAAGQAVRAITARNPRQHIEIDTHGNSRPIPVRDGGVKTRRPGIARLRGELDRTISRQHRFPLAGTAELGNGKGRAIDIGNVAQNAGRGKLRHFVGTYINIDLAQLNRRIIDRRHFNLGLACHLHPGGIAHRDRKGRKAVEIRAGLKTNLAIWQQAHQAVVRRAHRHQ